MERNPTISDLLRKLVIDAPSLKGIERATGVKRQSLIWFRRGRTITLETADKLAAYFGVECRQTKKGR
jgi:hypothetical protein